MRQEYDHLSSTRSPHRLCSVASCCPTMLAELGDETAAGFQPRPWCGRRLPSRLRTHEYTRGFRGTVRPSAEGFACVPLTQRCFTTPRPLPTRSHRLLRLAPEKAEAPRVGLRKRLSEISGYLELPLSLVMSAPCLTPTLCSPIPSERPRIGDHYMWCRHNPKPQRDTAP